MTTQCFGSLRAACLLALCAGSVYGCSSAGLGPGEDLGSRQDLIYGGTADTTHDAVRALIRFGNTSLGACSGTTIARQAGSGILLTAAHCVLAIDANDQVVLPIQVVSPSSLYVLPGTDWQKSFQDGTAYFVAEITVHPLYDGRTENPYDLALVRYLGATDATPVIPVLPAADDQLAIGSPFTLVGYGKTETNGNNSQRRKVDKVVGNINARQILYDQNDGKGTCQGDSGGPALVQTPGGERVAGVTSYGNVDCSGSSVSVRVSSSAAFVQGVLNAVPTVLSCEVCRGAAVGPGDPCAAAWAPCTTVGSACNRFLACATPCQDSACYDACVAKNPTGAKLNDDLTTCECTTACSKECSHDTSCGRPSCGGLTVPGALCTSCIQQSCCQQADLCGNDATCAACFGLAGTQCASNALYNGLLGCLAQCDGNPCKVAAPKTGTPADAGVRAEAGAAVGDAAALPAGDGAAAVPYQVTSTPVAAAAGGCSCRQTQSDGRGLGRLLAASCLVAIAAMRVRSRRRQLPRQLIAAR